MERTNALLDFLLFPEIRAKFCPEGMRLVRNFILVTGGARFHRNNFVLDWLEISDDRVINLDIRSPTPAIWKTWLHWMVIPAMSSCRGYW